jgi:nucleoside-diphosphate-sugar epimerase
MLLVTGATGFIGSHLVERAPGPVRCLVRRSGVQFPRGVESIRADLTTGEGLDEALRDVHTIIHLAGVTKALRAEEYFTGNVRASENLARRAARRGIRFVHVSSLAAAGPSLDGTPVTEEEPPHPVSIYGRSKLEAEQAVRASLPDAVIVRPPVVYGPRDTDVYQILKAVARRLWLEIGPGGQRFSAIYVGDLVEGLLAASREPQAAGRIYYLSHAKSCTWGDLAGTAAQIMGVRPRHVRVPVGAAYAVAFGAELWARLTGRPGIVSRDKIAEARYPHWTCNPRRAAIELGFQASTSLAEALAQTLAWYKEAGWVNY